MEKLTPELAELIGIHLGDGCISITKKYSEYALSGDLNEEKEYYDNIIVPLFNKTIAIPILNKEIQAKAYPSIGTYGFFIFNKDVVEFFQKLGIKSGSKKNISIPKKFLNKNLINHLLRGLFNTDGSLYFQKNYGTKLENRIHKKPIIELGITSKKLALQVKNILIRLGYSPYWKKPYKGKRDKNFVYYIFIHRKVDIERWMAEIGFNSPKHNTKWLVFKKLGYCPPYTTIKERKQILEYKYL